MSYEPLDARLEYRIWYDNGDGDAGIAEFESLEEAEQFSSSNKTHQREHFVWNRE
ncbi:hypothetical protein RAC89_17310 [Paenibacillus sp. GD4]|jgi:hypothetical protein|uniref:hypothetical protein n=1 Tax=Paenibacillus TaxID=44249 RepID=UPI002543F805|nr:MULTISPECIES: hypothetical protein [Paenibacillus]MDQ1912147.1 hypothetical protein [Paenibacillus sp. GD4]